MEIILFVLVVMLVGIIFFLIGFGLSFWLIWWFHKKMFSALGINFTQAVFWASSYWHQVFDLNIDTGHDVQRLDEAIKWLAGWAFNRIKKKAGAPGNVPYKVAKVAWEMKLPEATDPGPPPAPPAP